MRLSTTIQEMLVDWEHSSFQTFYNKSYLHIEFYNFLVFE